METLAKHTIRYCPACGSNAISCVIPSGDNRPRHCCDQCGYIQYFNPVPVVGAVLSWQDKILLCQRSIEPRKGLWTYPAGFMELHESLRAGAERESAEEACAGCDDMHLFAVFALHREGQLHVIYRGQLRDGHAQAGSETEAVQMVGLDEICWEQLAFPVIHETLKLYLSDSRRGSFSLHQGSIFSHADGSWSVEHEPSSAHSINSSD